MKKYFTYLPDHLRKLSFLVLFTFPVLPIKGTHLIFMLYSILVLLIFVKEKLRFEIRSYIPYALLSLLFLPYFIEWLLYSENAVVQFETEKKLLFCIAPFIFYLDSRLKMQVNRAFAPLVFSVVLFLMSLVSLVYLIANGYLFSPEGADQAFQLRLAFETFSGLHPTYYGLFCSTASLWMASIYTNCTKAQKTVLILMLFPMILLNVILASKMALLILMTGTAWFVYRFSKNIFTKIALFFSLLAGLSLLIFLIPSLQSRLSEFSTFFNYKSSQNTLVERLVIFNCSESIFLADFLTGIGSRNTQALLDYCYMWVGYPKGALIHLNSHNQFFTFGINYGIGMMVTLLLVVVYYVQKSKSSVLAVVFWLSAFLIMLSESILERQMGVYYFLFFALLFISVSNKKTTQATGV